MILFHLSAFSRIDLSVYSWMNSTLRSLSPILARKYLQLVAQIMHAHLKDASEVRLDTGECFQLNGIHLDLSEYSWYSLSLILGRTELGINEYCIDAHTHLKDSF